MSNFCIPRVNSPNDLLSAGVSNLARIVLFTQKKGFQVFCLLLFALHPLHGHVDTVTHNSHLVTGWIIGVLGFNAEKTG